MADTIMSDTKDHRVPNVSDVQFDGSVLDLERVLAAVNLQFLLYPIAFGSDSTKVAFLLAHFRGPALDWAGRLLSDERPGNVARLQDYEATVSHVKASFGYEASQQQAIAQTRLAALHQSGDLLEFLTEFEGLTLMAGCASDASRMTQLLPKLNKRYRDALVLAGDTLSTYSTVRNRLFHMYSRDAVQEKSAEGQRSKSRCKKCGKRGHTATQCVAKN